MITQIGFLRKGDVFRFEGDIYKVGHLLESTNGYVSCIDVNTGKKKRLHIDDYGKGKERYLTKNEFILYNCILTCFITRLEEQTEI